MCQRSPSRLSADILAQNVDFLSQFFIFAFVLVNLQLGSGGVLQVLGQLAANVVGILLAFFIQAFASLLTYSTGSLEDTTYLEPQISTLTLFCAAMQTILSILP